MKTYFAILAESVEKNDDSKEALRTVWKMF